MAERKAMTPWRFGLEPASAGVTVQNRRTFLRAAFGLAGAATLVPPGQATATRRKADTACIVLFLDGGPSHLETFDPKPDAPAEVRGEFRPIPTSVSGMRIAE